MGTSSTSTTQPPLRVWPAVVIAAVVALARFVLPVLFPQTMIFGVLAGVFGGLAVLLWWLFFSRAAWPERVGAVALMAVALVGTWRLVDKSIAMGAMGMLFPLLAIPVLSLAFVGWAVASRRLADGPRRIAMAATILVACGGWTLVKTGGFTANFDNDFAWRWAQTPEDRLVAQEQGAPALTAAPPEAPAVARTPDPATSEPAASEPPAPSSTAKKPPAARVSDAPASSLSHAPARPEVAAEWPGFRGPNRDGIATGVRINTDWSATPPVELWRRPIGPGWSSFAVRGDFVYTQEQRGDEEVVACYRASTGEPIWKHRDRARFWESNAGPGPRATPTLSNGRVYTLGGTGIVNVLDADTGGLVWSRDAAADTGAKVPTWGFAGSPLVVGDLVVVAASGTLIAYDLADGHPRWLGPKGREGYSSPHLLTIDGVVQVLFVSGSGVTSVTAADGSVIWEHPWKGYPIVQPAMTADGSVLVAIDESSGTRRIAPARKAEGWAVEERWTSSALKPYFNDFVVHQGHAYGFDGGILACIDVADGTRRWKGGRYGNGQLVLLPEQDALLVLSEEGELALVRAAPDRFTQLARFPALEGKTWNHPVVVGDLLLTRNGEQMAAFRLPVASP
ncbi:MAG TPA: PQQ-binding-like beta-propeller repeat protein [Vicinamibacteria bacterium]|nr:PQQ-binding-like beta-propeller repeat protein [Vicinamibacteria bacterium]